MNLFKQLVFIFAKLKSTIFAYKNWKVILIPVLKAYFTEHYLSLNDEDVSKLQVNNGNERMYIKSFFNCEYPMMKSTMYTLAEYAKKHKNKGTISLDFGCTNIFNLHVMNITVKFTPIK